MSTKIVTRAFFAVFASLLFIGSAQAGITMTLDRDMVDFRIMESGQTREIADQGVYHNQLTCTSTNDQTWYIKVNMIRSFTAGMNTIPDENFKWMVVDVINGKGIVTNNKNISNAFTRFPSLVYTSDPADNTGVEVALRFRYILTIPEEQIAGNYVASARWTMIEIL